MPESFQDFGGLASAGFGRLDQMSADRLGRRAGREGMPLSLNRVLPVSADDGSGHQGVDPATPGSTRGA
jgi:hypothetical protein